MGEFLISSLLLLSLLGTKLYFFYSEPEFSGSAIAKVEIVSFVLLFVFGLVSFFRLREPWFAVRSGFIFKPVNVLLVCTVFLTLLYSFTLNINKKAIDWDAIALYEARSVYFSKGIRFSEMNSLSEFDLRNKYYYALYPPYTSLIHTFWKNFYGPQVSVVYSVYLSFLAITIILFTKKYLGTTASLFLTLLSISNKPLFDTSLIEYTNLPYTLFFTLGTLLLFDFFIERKNWKILYAILAIAGTQWIRFSEPVWLMTCLGVAYYWSVNRAEKLVNIKRYLLLFLVFGAVEYFAWSYFVRSIALTPQIFSEHGILRIVEMLIGAVTGSDIVVAIKFVQSLGTVGIILACAIFVTETSDKPDKFLRNLKFLETTIVLQVLLYYLILYYLAFQADWWQEIGGSINRSLTFLIPVSTFLIIYQLRAGSLLKEPLPKDREMGKYYLNINLSKIRNLTVKTKPRLKVEANK